MLYVEDSDGSRWLGVAELLSEREAYDMVLCSYPDSASDPFPGPFRAPQTPESLERASEPIAGEEAPCSARVRVSSEFLDALRPYIGEFEDWGESLSLYPLTERSWVAAYIPHERIVIVRDVRLHGFLDAAGIHVCLEPPEGLERTW